MRTPETTAESFRDLDFHDDTCVAIRILPPQRRGETNASAVEIELLQYSQNALRVVRFSGCRNLRVAVDFDVLAGNLPPNTSGVDAHTNLNRMRDLVQSQTKDWGVEYEGTSVSPLVGKLTELGELVCFHIQFFGGAIDVIARDYSVRAANNVPEATAG
jgi:hypothetical protein